MDILFICKWEVHYHSIRTYEKLNLYLPHANGKFANRQLQSRAILVTGSSPIHKGLNTSDSVEPDMNACREQNARLGVG